MSILITCDCGRIFHVKEELAGQRRKCPDCRRVFVVAEPPTDDQEVELEPIAEEEDEPVFEVADSEESLAPQRKRRRARRLELPNLQGMVLAMLLGVAFLLIPGAGLVVLADNPSDGKITGVVLCAILGFLLGVATFVCTWFGTRTEIVLASRRDGRVDCTILRRIAYLLISQQQVKVAPGDHLLKRVLFFSQTKLDLLGLPLGIFFVGRNRGKGAQVHFYLAPRRRKPILLYRKFVKDYFGTRYGDPTEVKRITNFFASMIQIETVTEEVTL